MAKRKMSTMAYALRLAELLILAPLTLNAQDVLPPEQAFPLTASADADSIHVDLDIRDGYYLYRQRFSFASATSGLVLGSPEFPAGKIYQDEFFGEMEIYRGPLRIDIPYQRSGNLREATIEIGLQGCADIGLCYPPQKWSRSVALPPAATSSLASSLFAPAADAPLAPEDAFIVNARFDRANELTVGWQIAPGYYLYRDKFGFAAEGGVELGLPVLPPGQPHADESFGEVDVYFDYVEAVIPFSRASPEAMPLTLEVAYQGCKESSICYPPMTQTLPLVLPASSEFFVSGNPPAAAPGPVVMQSEQDRLAALVTDGSLGLVLATFYGLGLLLAFTPCVLPMVPILSGIIAGQGAQVSAGRGFALSFAYVMGMALTYTGAGALAALAGEQIQAIFQKPWIITIFALLFVVLALAMFGAIQLQMPAAVQTRMAQLANRQRAGTFIGTAIMGALSALIVTTCVAPPLVATLAVIGQTGDVARGAGALFALSMGMGSPLLAVGASAGKLLPRVGPWMNAVKGAFGVMMLGLAIWMLERVLPGNLTLALWALLVFMSGVFLGALEPLPQPALPAQRLRKGLGLLACLYGALLLIGATLGGQDPLQPIPRSGLFSAGTGPAGVEPALQFEAVESVAALERALGDAAARMQPVMVDFTAEWCVSCKEMEEYTFPDAGVVSALSPFMLLRADVTANDEGDKALLKYFSSYGPPTIAFYDRHGQPQDAFKLVGFVPPEKFAEHVRQLAAL
jgi:thiol:disulfide interchange protein DsbD